MKTTKHHWGALSRIQKKFPKVTKVRDSRKTIEVTVDPSDAASGRKKDPGQCALARACMRTKIADAAIIGLGYSWLIKGNTATRYKTSVGVSREITSFDRHQDFHTGRHYKLSRVSPTERMGRCRGGERAPHTTKAKPTQKIHNTADVRVIKG